MPWAFAFLNNGHFRRLFSNNVVLGLLTTTPSSVKVCNYEMVEVHVIWIRNAYVIILVH